MAAADPKSDHANKLDYMNENNNFSLKKIDIQEKKNNSNQSDFTLTYFPIGLATTVGNSLRRILLSLSSG